MDRVRRRPVAAAVLPAVLVGLLCGCKYLVRDASFLYLKVNAELTSRDIEIEFKKSFIEKYKDRVSISTVFTVDKTLAKPRPGLLDGDLHFAGRATEIGLPAVAEIANAETVMPAVDLVNRFAGTGQPLGISGVWRIWAEHPKRAEERQGEALLPETSHNPGHVFEIHPVTRIDDMELRETFRPVEGFIAGEARKTFAIYKSVECRITPKGKTISLVTQKGIYNNVEFLMELADPRQIEVEGGRFVIATVMDLKGEKLVDRVRLVFADETPPERAVKELRPGGRLHLFGLPRIDLAEVWRRVKASRRDPSVLTKPLPFEIIVQGAYK